MRFSKFFAPTLKEAPKDAVLSSHALLSRAGYIDQLGSGIYSYLPLAKLLLERIKAIINHHMQRAGSNYMEMSYAVPALLWEQSGRLAAYGDELLRFSDRKNTGFLLAPTHEESVVASVRGKINSYKQLPLSLYQISCKFRDEARPRFGLLRGREFVMKDAYSFHADLECLDKEFELMKSTYFDIFNELGLDFVCIEADSGAIGGSGSMEFMALSSVGEDEIAISSKYAANVEVAVRAKRKQPSKAPEGDFARFNTGDLANASAMARFFRVSEYFCVKALAKLAVFDDGSKRELLFFLRADDDLEETKAKKICGATELMDIEASVFSGPFGLDFDFYIDIDLKDAKNMICGANEEGFCFVGASMSNIKASHFADLARVREGDICAISGEKLQIKRGIELGHIFKLGDKYSKPMNATFLDSSGRAKPFIMGCYGIGVSRLIAVLAEHFHDDLGLCFPAHLAPFKAVLIPADSKNEEQKRFCEELYEGLGALQNQLLYDDRAARFGVKMSDFELLGMPKALIVGKSLENGFVELVDRASGKKQELEAKEAQALLEELLK